MKLEEQPQQNINGSNTKYFICPASGDFIVCFHFAGLVFPDLRFHVLYFVISYFWIVVWVFLIWYFWEYEFSILSFKLCIWTIWLSILTSGFLRSGILKLVLLLLIWDLHRHFVISFFDFGVWFCWSKILYFVELRQPIPYFYFVFFWWKFETCLQRDF